VHIYRDSGGFTGVRGDFATYADSGCLEWWSGANDSVWDFQRFSAGCGWEGYRLA
jgi:hypothetical protein